MVRRAETQRRVRLSQVERAIIVGQAALIKLERPNIPWGPCLNEAIDRAVIQGELPAHRKITQSTIASQASTVWKPLIQAEVQRIIEERVVEAAVQNALKPAEPEAPSTLIQPPAPSPSQEAANESIHPDMAEMMKIGQQAVGVFLTPLIDSMAAEFKRRLEIKFRGVASEVLTDLAHGVNPTPVQAAPIHMGTVTAHDMSLVNALIPENKVKVALVGDHTDNLYFQKCTKGLEDFFEFVPVFDLRDVRRAVDATFVVASSSGKKTVMNAMMEVCKTADFIKGKGTPDVRVHLIKTGLTPQQRSLIGS